MQYTYYIRTRYVMIVGSEYQGKTTLARIIQNSFKGKTALISPKETDVYKLASDFFKAAQDIENKMIIIDARLILRKELNKFFDTLRYFMKGISERDFTIFKVNMSYEKNRAYAIMSKGFRKEEILEQRSKYAGKGGLLYSNNSAGTEMHFFNDRAFEVVFV